MKKANQTDEKIVIQDKSQKHFVIIYESVYKNRTLTNDELILLFRLITKAPNFTLSFNGLKALLKWSGERLAKNIKGLKEKGYLKIESHGKNGATWTINQEPTIRAEKLTFEGLKNILDLNYYFELYKMKYIDLKLYQKLIDNLTRIAKTEWIKKPEIDD